MDFNFTVYLMDIIKFLVGLFGLAVVLFGGLCTVFDGWSFYGSYKPSFSDRAVTVGIMVVGSIILMWGW